MTEQATIEDARRASWLTVEVLLYAAILILALGLRLARLDTRLMDVPEAQTALQAWELAHGSRPAGTYSPLLLTGQAFLFAVFGAGDAAVRLLPALAGSAMVLGPYLLRPHLGRWGALGAALALAVSPTLVYVAREGSGAGLLVPLLLGIVTLWLAYLDTRRPAYPPAIAVLGALALIADPRVIGALLMLAAAWAVERFHYRRDLIAPPAPMPWRQLLIVLAAVLLLTATALTLNLGGLSAWVEFPAAWARHMAPLVNGQPWHYPLTALLLYEPLALILGIWGAIDWIAHRGRGTVLIWLALGALLLALLAGGRDAGDVALIVAFLALPAGYAFGSIVENWQRASRLPREGIYALAALVVVAFVAMEGSFYAFALYHNLQEASRFLWFWLLAVALVVILVGLMWAWHGADVTWRVGGAVVALLLLLTSFSAAVSLNFYRPNDPRELHVHVTSDPGLRTALQVMDRVAYHLAGSPVAAPITVEAELGPVWLWYLRGWEKVDVVETLSPDVSTPLVLSSAQEPRVALGERYIGHDFVTRTWWQPAQLVTNDQLSWWLYRQTIVKPLPVQEVVLWMQAPEQIADTD